MASLPSRPEFQLPQSSSTVGVSIIDTGARISFPAAFFVQEKIRGHELFDVSVFSFLIEHSSGSKLLFDLGMRPDFESLAPVVLSPIKQLLDAGLYTVSIETDVATILQRAGTALSDIDAIILSHGHADHTGDPSTFPHSTSLVVGPGFQAALLPGYPTNPKSPILESDYKGRELRELDFETDKDAVQLGRFQAIDYFGDGSFYLLNAPGHTSGHIAALARTTPTTFMLLGGDTCHHAGSLRPTKYMPLPDELSPSPFSDPPFAPGSICPGEIIATVSPHKARDEPFYQDHTPADDRDVPQIKETIAKTTELDAFDDVFVVIAHDSTLLNVVDFFPKKANDWKAKGWKEESKWKFLADFSAAQNP